MIILTSASCDSQKYSAGDRQDIITAEGNDCPDITGTYSIMDRAGYLKLGGHYEKKPKNWAIINISGNAQQELHIRLYESDSGATNETPIKRVKDEDYSCQNGLLETKWPAEVRLNRSEDAIPESHEYKKSLSFAKSKTGELVMRTNIRHWKGVSVWCGDGCKSMPVPFTSRTRYKWSHWPSADIPDAPTADASASSSSVSGATIFNENTVAGSITESVIADDGTPEARAKRAISKMTKPGAALVRLSNNGKIWKAVLRGDTHSLYQLHEAALSSNEILIRDVKISSTPGSQKEVHIEFLLPPTQEEREAKKAKEQSERQLASAHEAEGRALVKRLLPSIPKGMTITASQHDAKTFLVEVRHENEDTFYELIARAISSGEFSQANIKTRKNVDTQGKQVADILLIPTSHEQTNNEQTQLED